MRNSNYFMISAVLTCVTLSCSQVTAHTLSGSLARKFRATDMYQVTCFDDGNGVPARLIAQIQDAAPLAAPFVSLQVIRGAEAVNSTDPVDGDANYSRLVTNTGGTVGANGAFTVLVNKSGNGVERYQVEIHCLAASGDHTGTDAAQVQDQ